MRLERDAHGYARGCRTAVLATASTTLSQTRPCLDVRVRLKPYLVEACVWTPAQLDESRLEDGCHSDADPIMGLRRLAWPPASCPAGQYAACRR